MDKTTQLAMALIALANAQRAASTLWDEMEETMSADEFERALSDCDRIREDLIDMRPEMKLRLR